MNIALIGYGKMGHMIEQIALSRGHVIVVRIDKENSEDIHSDAFRLADVAIEFTTPMTAEQNIRAAWAEGVPVVCGSTGWDSAKLIEEMRTYSPWGDMGKAGLIWTSNYSLGVNILFAMNERLAQIMQAYPQYTPSIKEVHHVHKLDHPSGTAKTLGEQIPGFDSNTITSIREGEVPGIHTVTWDSNVDTITPSHSAKSREGFALGAVLAAEWLKGKTGFHTMREVLGF